MRITCPQCGFFRELPDNKVPVTSTMATCPKCRHRFKFRQDGREQSTTRTEPRSRSSLPGLDTGESSWRRSGSAPARLDLTPPPASRFEPEPQPDEEQPEFPAHRTRSSMPAEPAPRREHEAAAAHPAPATRHNRAAAPDEYPDEQEPLAPRQHSPAAFSETERPARNHRHDPAEFSPASEPAPNRRRSPAPESVAHKPVAPRDLPEPAAPEEEDIPAPVAREPEEPPLESHRAAQPARRAAPAVAPQPEPEPEPEPVQESKPEPEPEPKTAKEPEAEAPEPAAPPRRPADGVRDIWARLQAMDASDSKKRHRHGSRDDADEADEAEETPRETVTDPIPWERLDAYGFLPGLFLTLKKILFTPLEFFTEMPDGRPKGKALVFNLLISEFLLVLDFLWSLFGLRAKFGGPAGQPDALGAAASSPSLAFLFALLLVPLGIACGIYLDAWFTHLLLLLFRSAKKGFNETFRVMCYSAAPTVLSAIPVAGQILSPVILVWYMALQAIGLKKAHDGAYTQTLAAIFIKWSIYLFLLLALLQNLSPGH